MHADAGTQERHRGLWLGLTVGAVIAVVGAAASRAATPTTSKRRLGTRSVVALVLLAVRPPRKLGDN
jgi:hypothetical protein